MLANKGGAAKKGGATVGVDGGGGASSNLLPYIARQPATHGPAASPWFFFVLANFVRIKAPQRPSTCDLTTGPQSDDPIFYFDRLLLL
jgi:hypothetical protein